jgi:hypothetical protein
MTLNQKIKDTPLLVKGAIAATAIIAAVKIVEGVKHRKQEKADTGITSKLVQDVLMQHGSAGAKRNRFQALTCSDFYDADSGTRGIQIQAPTPESYMRQHGERDYQPVMLIAVHDENPHIAAILYPQQDVPDYRVLETVHDVHEFGSEVARSLRDYHVIDPPF